MRIVFDPSLDGSAWPGPAPHVGAVIGEAWLGPWGLLGRLETELGLAGLAATRIERAVQLCRRLAETEGFWSASYEADALGTAERLLADRDRLRLWGWRGEPVSARLQALAEVTGAVLPGLPDRLEAVVGALEHGRPDIDALELAFPEALLPTLWRQVLAGLTVRPYMSVVAPASGDLGAARDGRFAPTGDGSLTLFRPHGPLAAAEEVAGALAARDTLDDVLIVGADRVLAAALDRAGLPRPAVAGEAPSSMAALRLVVELMFRPSDPALVYKLLCLDPGPIPRTIGRRLTRALGDFPGRGTPRWNEELERGLEDIDEPRRDPVRARVTCLLDPLVPRDQPVPPDAVIERMTVLARWARGAAERHPCTVDLALAAESVSRLLRAMPVTELTWVVLRRLLDDLDGAAASLAGPSDAGLACVHGPGAVLGPAPTIIWWGFTRDRAPRPPRLRLSEAERAALEHHDITPPNASLLAAGHALAWRRPLEQATGALLLVCPRTSGGDRAFPHPLWDELTAAAGHQGAARLVTRELTGPRRTTAPLRPLPVPQVSWQVDRPLPLRENGESPSSLETLLGCPLSWTLQYRGKLYPRFSPPAAPSPLLFGNIAHHLIALIFADGLLAAGAARARARAVLDDELPTLCETLYLPRYQVERAQVEHAIIESAAELARLVTDIGATIRGVEVSLEKDTAGIRLHGFADMVLSGPDAVIDLKWSKTTSRNKLRSGTALQLAAYAEMARSGPAHPHVAYFILKTQELLAESTDCFPDAQVPGQLLAADTWRGAAAALARVRANLESGTLEAPGATGLELDSDLTGDLLTIAPKCRFCDHGVLCGRGGAS